MAPSNGFGQKPKLVAFGLVDSTSASPRPIRHSGDVSTESSPEPTPGAANPHDPVLAWVLGALATVRTTGAPALGCLAGIQAIQSPEEGRALGFADIPGAQRLGVVEMAMLADLALGGALRASVGLDRPLPTLSLSLDLAGTPRAASDLTAHTMQSAIGDGLGTAGAVLHNAGETVGHASATFAIPSRGSQPVMPWDDLEPPQVRQALRRADLTNAENAVVRTILAAEATTDAESWGDRLVRDSSEHTRRDHGISLRFTPSPVTTNRAGSVQGAVLFALAAHAAAAGDTESLELASGQMRFVSPTDASHDVLANASIEYASRRTVFVRCHLTQATTIRASVGFVFRRPGQ